MNRGISRQRRRGLVQPHHMQPAILVEPIHILVQVDHPDSTTLPSAEPCENDVPGFRFMKGICSLFTGTPGKDAVARVELAPVILAFVVDVRADLKVVARLNGEMIRMIRIQQPSEQIGFEEPASGKRVPHLAEPFPVVRPTDGILPVLWQSIRIEELEMFRLLIERQELFGIDEKESLGELLGRDTAYFERTFEVIGRDRFDTLHCLPEQVPEQGGGRPCRHCEREYSPPGGWGI